MNLIELYIQEVTRRIPEKNRQDIALELRSTIEDMLPEPYSEEDVKAVLTKLGHPAVLASGYSERPMHLIGPRYYDIYVRLLKMVLPIAIAVSIITMVANNILGYGGSESLPNLITTIVVEVVVNILYVALQVFFWTTLVFAILERIDRNKEQVPLSASLKKWTPEDLKHIHPIPPKKAISNFEVFGSLLLTAIWATVYFNAVKLVGVYVNGPQGLELTIPTFNQEVLNAYWPLVAVVIGFEAGLAIYKWIKAQWTHKIAVLNIIRNFASSILWIVLLSTSDLLQPAFVSHMAELFNVSIDWKNTILWAAGLIFVFFAVLDSFEGIRKARIPN